MAHATPVAGQPLLAGDSRPLPTWAAARRHLEEADTYWLATVRPDGRPHVVPVLAIWAEDALHFVASGTSRKARNLAHDARCVITTGSGALDLVVEGEAAIVRDEARLERVAGAYAAKYDWLVTVREGAFYGEGAPTAGPPPYDVYEMKPAVVLAFGTDESFSAIRWRFREG